MSHDELEAVAKELCPKFKGKWYLNSILLCLRYDGKCAYCGLDLLSSQGICYQLWCLDHLLPQVHYPELIDHPENHILACRSCNGIKADFDADPSSRVYLRSNEFSAQHAEQLFQIAKAHVNVEKARLEAAFKEELELFKPYVRRLSSAAAFQTTVGKST